MQTILCYIRVVAIINAQRKRNMEKNMYNIHNIRSDVAVNVRYGFATRNSTADYIIR